MKYEDMSTDDLYLLEIERQIVAEQRRWKNENKPLSFLEYVLGIFVSAGVVGTVTYFLLRWFR